MTKPAPIERSTVDALKRNLSRTTVMAIGVSKYRYLMPLKGPAKDLRIVENLFLNQNEFGIYEPRQFTALLNPTVEKVRSTLTQYVRTRSARGDILILYFSGHGCIIGANNFGFCFADTVMSSFDEGGILPLSVINFRDIVQTLSAGDIHPVFIIDACFSAATAREFDSKVTSVMHDDLHNYSAGSYGLLCSSNSVTASVDTDDGGPFTHAVATIIAEGLSANKLRYWPFITLRNISQPVQERLTLAGSPLSKQYLGPDLPEVPIARNNAYKPLAESFSPYMRRILQHIWNNGSPKEAHHEELRNSVGPGAYGNHSKLSLPPWNLVEDGQRKRTRRLTEKGKKFMDGKAKIPDKIIKDPLLWEWVAAPDCKMISINDVPYIERLLQ